MPDQVLVFEHILEYADSREKIYHLGSRCEMERWTAGNCFDGGNPWTGSHQAAGAYSQILKDRAMWHLQVNRLRATSRQR
jgi:hypothetical protein